MKPVVRRALLMSAAAVLLLLAVAVCASAAGLSDDSGAEWAVEQPLPPPAPPGVESSKIPIPLGRIGDIEFWEPNRGALITAGNGTSVPAGVWFYNGVSWRELSSKCGATEGRIAWAGPDEFWTISDGRPGQAIVSPTERPPLEDNTLCHFAPGPTGLLGIVASYASPAFLPSSYQAMHAAACIGPSDCWFGGEPLPAPQVGAFQLNWNGHTVEREPYLPEGHTVRDMRAFDGKLYESVQLLTSDRYAKKAPVSPPPLRIINPAGVSPSAETVFGLPLYSEEEFAFALDFLHLSSDESALWAAAGPQPLTPVGSEPAGVTIVRKEAGAEAHWSQVIGPETHPSGTQQFPEDLVNSIAAEPGTSSAWIALAPAEGASSAAAQVARVSADGTVSDEATLPEAGDPHGDLGAAKQIVCPATHDCWLATQKGWLLHLASAEERAHPDPELDPAFAGEEPITNRPPDEGVPQEPSDVLPSDTSGLEEQAPSTEQTTLKAEPERFAKVTVPLLSHLHSHLIHRTTLQLSFHLAVKARVRLIADRRGSVVAETPLRSLSAGNHSLQLRLNPRRWPTKLKLQTHALAALPTTSTREAGTNSVSTSLVFPDWHSAANWAQLP